MYIAVIFVGFSFFFPIYFLNCCLIAPINWCLSITLLFSISTLSFDSGHLLSNGSYREFPFEKLIYIRTWVKIVFLYFKRLKFSLVYFFYRHQTKHKWLALLVLFMEEKENIGT